MRGLLVLATLLAAVFAWFIWRLERARFEDRAAEAIVRAGGEIAYANQFYGGVSRLTPFPRRTTWIGSWSQRILGADPFRRIVSVTLYDDDSISLLSKYSLTGLEIISINGGASITDEGLSHIRGCKQLRVLNLERADVTDDGLENILGCSRLEELWLGNTRVSDVGLQRIARLPSLFVLDICGTQISNDGLRVVAKMPALAALRAPVAVNRKLGDDGVDVLGNVFDDPRPRLLARRHPALAHWAAFQPQYDPLMDDGWLAPVTAWVSVPGARLFCAAAASVPCGKPASSRMASTENLPACGAARPATWPFATKQTPPLRAPARKSPGPPRW